MVIDDVIDTVFTEFRRFVGSNRSYGEITYIVTETELEALEDRVRDKLSTLVTDEKGSSD